MSTVCDDSVEPNGYGTISPNEVTRERQFAGNAGGTAGITNT